MLFSSSLRPPFHNTALSVVIIEYQQRQW